MDENNPVFESVEITGAGASSFKLRPRGNVTAFPVPHLQPVTENTVLAFDLMPKGSPSEVSGHGFVWMDICDADLEADPSAPVSCARVGVRGAFVEFGSRSFNGATVKPIVFTLGSANNPLQSLRLETNGDAVARPSSASGAGFRLPHGVAPSSPVNGDIWSTSAGLFARINGVTKQVSLV